MFHKYCWISLPLTLTQLKSFSSIHMQNDEIFSIRQKCCVDENKRAREAYTIEAASAWNSTKRQPSNYFNYLVTNGFIFDNFTVSTCIWGSINALIYDTPCAAVHYAPTVALIHPRQCGFVSDEKQTRNEHLHNLHLMTIVLVGGLELVPHNRFVGGGQYGCHSRTICWIISVFMPIN